MDGIERSEEQVREANQLYWESETSVNRIANRLGLSKGSLYAAIEPLASGSICPLCSAALVYTNRTALEKGQLVCSLCSTTFSEEAGDGRLRRSPSAPAVPTASEPSGTSDHPVPVAPSGDRPSRQLVLSTTMLGLGFGMLLHRVLRR